MWKAYTEKIVRAYCDGRFPTICRPKHSKIVENMHVIKGGMGGGIPCPFSKIGKKFPNFEGKNALIVVIYR